MYDVLYGMLIDDEVEMCEFLIYVLVDLIIFFVWGIEGNFYDFEVFVTGLYTDVVFERFVDVVKCKMFGGVLMLKMMYWCLYGDIKV